MDRKKTKLPLNEALEFKRCATLLVREHWFLGSRRGEAAAIYFEFGDNEWVEVVPDLAEACWAAQNSDSNRAHEEFGDGDSHYPVRDAGAAYGLVGARINRVTEQRIGERIEMCLEFVGGVDLTLHYSLITQESSLYFTRD